ncbi:uncharacterized protein LOC116199631 isoform X2 [Punica granatum]|uniref:Uncharacterized protein LOC116199631 isoform X2 n=1 Tax=Punica granatum TaxID=22663 RepID=A0A6P8D360_PUNGR|nr:uncharacterized protein LOC116199631 isoform X2 [Punica granatum]XP_031385937.1 uncharacterized protein LOC116199631 isoform X2 [Punica granatum]
MCDDGEKTCPLCAEEMDLTDQQLKPCKCGYEICVWCWHHIMGMAEKDETEGRCPACRTPYDKEKIVGTASKCERLVAEINMEKKMKSQKPKPKASEGRKQLSSVRVIQRNLVYVVGLPLNLADEDILQRKEYFGQYGKVLKVSMSRTAAGVIQQFPNNTCSVYITYSKEEEAIRCIQSVHGYALEGRLLRACFGTTKYCHAWLRNVPCNNPDCLYLHEVGSQEDSFTKDEIISAYTRSRVQQITANVNTTQKRSGNILPPPLDDYCNGTTASPGKPILKNALNGAMQGAATVKGSPPNGSHGRSMVLPAAASWGARALSCSSQVASSECSNGSSKHKADPAGGTASEAAVSHTDAPKRPPINDASHNVFSKNRVDSSSALAWQSDLDSEFSSFDKCGEQDGSLASTTKGSRQACVSSNKHSSIGSNMPINDDGPMELSSSPVEAEGNKIQNSSCDMASLRINGSVQHEPSGALISKSLVSDPHFIGSPENQDSHQQLREEQYKESLASPGIGKAVPSRDESTGTDKMPNIYPQVEDDVLSFDSQRLQDPEVTGHKVYSSNSISPLHLSEKFASNSLRPRGVYSDSQSNGFVHASSGSVIPSGHAGNSQLNSAALQMNVEQSFVRATHSGASQSDATDCQRNGASDVGESSIISNILSLDFDPWNDSLPSPHNLAKLLGETDKQQGSINAANNWKVQSNTQSRFSFARQEESISQPFDVELPFGVYGELPRNRSIGEDKEFHLHKLGIGNDFPSRSSAEIGNFAGSQYAINKTSVSRSQISAPPGFSVPSKAPPPGFSSHERVDQTSDMLTGNRLLDVPPFLRNTEPQPNGNSIGGSADIEFMDPAILAVGKGRLQAGGPASPGFDIRSFPQHLRAFENDSRLDLLTQRSASPHQSLGYDIGAGYTSHGDSYGVPSRILDQSPMGNLNYTQLSSFQQGRNSVMSNGHWNGWNEMQGGGNGMVMAELLRNERLGINKLFNGYEESKFRMPSSGDLYGRTFGM